ncbi:MAG: CHAT domain-containing tetratricopeptide repeat protein, partial [Pseudomonadota bacterium]
RANVESAQFDVAEKFLDDSEKIFDSLGKTDEKAMVELNKGKLCSGRGNYREALEYLEQAERKFEQSKNTKELFSVLNNRAVTLTYLCDYEKALESLDKAGNISPEPNLKNQAGLNNNFGLVYTKKQDFDKAIDHFQKSLDMYTENGNPIGKALILNNMGHVHECRSQYSEALKRHQEALQISRSIADKSGESLALNNMGCVKLRMGDYTGARADFEVALQIRSMLGMKHFGAETLNNLGLVKLTCGAYPDALKAFAEAEEMCEKAGSKSCKAWTLHNKAFALKDLGKFKDSNLSSQEAVRIAEQIGDRKLESTAVLRLGNLYEFEGWFDNAIQQYVKAAEIQQNIGDLFFQANTLSDLGNILAREGDCEEAEKFFSKALRIKKSISAPQVETLSKFSIFLSQKPLYCPDQGQVPTNQGQTSPDVPKTSRECVQLAQALVKPEQKVDLAWLTYANARDLLQTGPAASVGEFRRLNTMGKDLGIRKFVFLASVGEGQAYEKLGDWDNAQKSFKHAVDYAEQIRESLDERAKLKFFEGEEALGVKHITPYEGLARVLMKLGKDEESLQISEFTKARNFSEALCRRSEDGNSDVPKEIIAKDRYLNNEIAGLLRALEQAQLSQSTETAANIQKDLAAAQAKFHEHVNQLRQQYPLFSATKYPEPMPLSTLGLTDKEWAITYQVTDNGLLIHLVNGKKLVANSVKKVTAKQLSELVRKFREPMEIIPGKDTIRDKLKSFDFKTGKQISDILLADVLPNLPAGAALTIIPDDCLGTLPFEMLPLNDGGEIVDDGNRVSLKGVNFLGDRNRISYCQSLTALTLARIMGKKASPKNNLLVVADPVFHTLDARAIIGEQATRFAKSDEKFNSALMDAIEATSMGSFKLERLPLTGDLAEGLAEVFDQDATLFTGMNASKAKLLEDMGKELGNYGNLVFATHGFFSPDSPVFQEPILFLTLVPLGTDGFLRMSEVMGLNISADTVALTACQTGLGKRISGEGTMGMGRAFQYAGAKSALMSLWSVSEKASVRLVQLFFENIREGMNKAEALDKARKEIRAEGFDHPFYWAAFIMFGENS